MDKELEKGLEEQTKEAIWTSKKKRFSPVWIVPFVAIIVGAILAVEAMKNKGIEIKISFKSATGILAKKSVVKYKDIEVGKVISVDFSDDLKSVIITAEIKKNLENYLTEKTKFWIVHARLSADSVEGLDTLFSGSYIGMYPMKGRKKKRFFKGLEEPPVVVDLSNGVRLTLEAKDRGSIQIGSPIYYKKLKAGSVLGYHLSEDGKRVYFDVFIEQPYSKMITQMTKFWESSGIKASISGDGVDIEMESLTSILSGGISFDNFPNSASEMLSENSKTLKRSDDHFLLYPNKKAAQKVEYTKALYFWLYFQDSIRGLKVGAPVEFRGVKIGEVVNFFLMGDKKNAEFKIPILIKIEPERFFITDIKDKNQDQGMDISVLKKLVAKGLRAQLQTINLLTGDLFVNLDFYKDAKRAQLIKEKGLYVLPTVPATIETLKSDIQTLLDRLSRVPFEKIGENLNKSVVEVNTKILPEVTNITKTLKDLLKEGNITIQDLNKNILPKLNSLVKSLDKAVNETRNSYLQKNSKFNTKLLRVLDEVSRATKSIKSLADFLQRHPDSILKGK